MFEHFLVAVIIVGMVFVNIGILMATIDMYQREHGPNNFFGIVNKTISLLKNCDRVVFTLMSVMMTCWVIIQSLIIHGIWTNAFM